jgi:hypothetical protein
MRAFVEDVDDVHQLLNSLLKKRLRKLLFTLEEQLERVEQFL